MRTLFKNSVLKYELNQNFEMKFCSTWNIFYSHQMVVYAGLMGRTALG